MKLFKRGKKRSFKVLILEIFTVLILITIFGMSFLYYYRATDIILDLSDSVAREVTSKIIERSTNYIGTPAVQTRTISHLITNSDITKNREVIWKYAWQQLLVFPQVQSIFVADKNGSYVQVRREPKFATRWIDRSGKNEHETWLYRDINYNITRKLEKIPTFDPRTRPWFKNTKEFPRIYWTDVYVFTTAQTPGISASYPVLDKDRNLIAVTCLNSPLHSLSTFIAKQKVSKNSVILITNTKNEIIAFPEGDSTSRIDNKTGKRRLSYVSELKQKWITDAFKEYRKSSGLKKKVERSWFGDLKKALGEGRIPSLQELFLYPKRKFSVSRTEGKNYITYAAPFPKSFASRWEIVIVLPEEDLISPLSNLRQTAIITAILFMVFSLMLIYFIINTLTKPIIKLADETEKISSFDLDDIVNVASSIKEVDIMNRALVSATTGLQSFKKYVPGTLVRQLIEVGKEVRLGGEEKDITIFFSDIKGFTSITEKMPPNELMEHLSEYFQNMSGIVLNNQGTIDKYIGDAIMAFWGAPIKQDNAPYLACKCAVECKKLLKVLNDQWIIEGKYPLETRIGIHTGKTIVGNLGSNDRMNYTIIGNSTNLASRLEGVNSFYGTGIIISEDTYRRVAAQFYCRLLDNVSVKGQEKGYKIYELIDEIDGDIDQRVRRFKKHYEYGFQAYTNRDWMTAVKVFTKLYKENPKDKSVIMLLKRCRYYLKNEDKLPENWDGTFKLTMK